MLDLESFIAIGLLCLDIYCYLYDKKYWTGRTWV